jgi:hypothetical protein
LGLTVSVVLAQELGDFTGVGSLQIPALAAEVFDRLNYGFGHPFVGLLGTPDERKALTLGDALMLVGIIQA